MTEEDTKVNLVCERLRKRPVVQSKFKYTADELGCPGPQNKEALFDWQFDYLGKSALEKFGGISGLIEALHSDKEKVRRYIEQEIRQGLTTEEAESDERSEVYGINYQAPKKMASYLELVWDEFKELTMIVLTIAGIVSLVLGIITDTEGTGMWLSIIVMGDQAGLKAFLLFLPFSFV